MTQMRFGYSNIRVCLVIGICDLVIAHRGEPFPSSIRNEVVVDVDAQARTDRALAVPIFDRIDRSGDGVCSLGLPKKAPRGGGPGDEVRDRQARHPDWGRPPKLTPRLLGSPSN